MKALLKSFAERAASKAGGALVSKITFTNMQAQRLALLNEASTLYRKMLNKNEAVGIIFSFNRPVQLHALLSSYFHYAKNPTRIIVQYRASNPLAASVYKEVAALFKGKPVTFVEESTCRATLLEILSGLSEKKVFFLVDDIMFYRPVNMAQFTAINPLEFIPCLRMGPHLNYCYTMKMATPAPSLKNAPKHKGMLTWNWGDSGNEWNYPFSVDGNLFDTAEIIMMTRSSPFKAPNTYEGVLASFGEVAKNRPGLCYPHSVAVNIPANKVQTEVANYAGESHAVTPEEFLARWQNGEQISPTSFEKLEPNAPHFEAPFIFIKRAGQGSTSAKKSAPAKKAAPVKPKTKR